MTELSAAADFWFRCANSFHLMHTEEALHQSWKKPPRQHSSAEERRRARWQGGAGTRKLKPFLPLYTQPGGQWRQRRRPLWIAFMAWLRATRVWTNRLIPADATMRISINNARTLVFLEERYIERKFLLDLSKMHTKISQGKKRAERAWQAYWKWKMKN